MWLRYGRIHTKYLIFAVIFVASFFLFYILSLQLINRIFENSRWVCERLILFFYNFYWDFSFIPFRANHLNKYNKERHRNPNVIVAQYIGTGNLIGQISPGILWFLIYYYLKYGDG